MNETSYWSRIYSGEITDDKLTLEHSPFSDWASEQLRRLSLPASKEVTILDIGCGNGRDTYYLGSLGYTVVGIDSAVCPQNKDTATFQQHDALHIPDDLLRQANAIYVRFFLHALTAEQQNQFFKRLSFCCKPSTFILFETRSLNDPMAKLGTLLSENENFTTHYRRYQSVDDISHSSELCKLDVLQCDEVFNASPSLNDNPSLLRGVLRT